MRICLSIPSSNTLLCFYCKCLLLKPPNYLTLGLEIVHFFLEQYWFISGWVICIVLFREPSCIYILSV